MSGGEGRSTVYVGVCICHYAMVVEEKVRVGKREIGVCVCQGGRGRVKGEGVHMIGCKKGWDWGGHMTGCLGGREGLQYALLCRVCVQRDYPRSIK